MRYILILINKTKINKGITMKKITLAVFMILSSFSIASADLGIKIGVSAQLGELDTTGKEKSSAGTETENKKVQGMFATGGIFIEKELGFLPGPLSRFSVGYSNIAHDLNLGTQTNVRKTTLGAAGAVVNDANHSLGAEITDFETVYATLRITDWLYLKGGNVTMDVKTQFKGTLTSKYKTNHSLDGTVFGVGVQAMKSNGLFFRAEVNDYNIDGVTVTNTGADSVYSVVLGDVQGTTGRLSIGKRF